MLRWALQQNSTRTSEMGVRRDKAALSSGCKSHPATLQPEAAGAAMEVTKWLKPSESVSRIGDSASVQAVTRVNDEQASKRTTRRPPRQPFRGRLTRLGVNERRSAPSRCAGVVATACTQGKRAQHGRPQGVVRDDQPDAREGQAGRFGETERFAVPRKPGNAGGGKGPQFKTNARRGEGPGDWATYQLRRVFGSCRRRCTRKRRQKPAIASTPSTTRSAATTSWPMPMPSAAPTRAHRGWTVKSLRTSKRMGCNDGLANWRLRSGRRLTDQTPSEECSYRKPTPNSGRWASRPCAIGYS